MPALRAVAYYRKSNDDDGGSVDQQREWARTACEKEGGEGTNIDAIMAEIDRQDAAEAGEGGRKVETLKRRLRQLDDDLAEGIARLRSIDRSLLDDYQQGVKALRAERDKVAAELRRAGSEPTRAQTSASRSRAPWTC
jgi:hypothetical protein